MKTTKKAALAAASSALLLGLTVAQTVNADTYTVQNGDSFFGIASQSPISDKWHDYLVNNCS